MFYVVTIITKNKMKHKQSYRKRPTNINSSNSYCYSSQKTAMKIRFFITKYKKHNKKDTHIYKLMHATVCFKTTKKDTTLVKVNKK